MRVDKRTMKGILLLFGTIRKCLDTKYAYVPNGTIFFSTKEKRKFDILFGKLKSMGIFK